jgi:hypothetical protein
MTVIYSMYSRRILFESDADLRGANLRCADLRDADLHDADLRDADLHGANLRGANLRGANLHGANLRVADLRGANLRGADLHDADLRDADLRDADLRVADLRGANLRGAEGVSLSCPEIGSFIGFKKCRGDFIATIRITESSLRSSATGRKCRASEVEVLDIDKNGVHANEAFSTFNHFFQYKVGETISVNDFNENRWNECAPGIHFFITRKEAEEY